MFDSGDIILMQSVDFEQVREYMLTILGSDGGSPPLSSTSIVRIDIVDENDNAPAFVRPTYEFSIMEDTAVNTTIVQVIALDLFVCTKFIRFIFCTFCKWQDVCQLFKLGEGVAQRNFVDMAA